MPYRRKANKIYVQKDGVWHLKSTCKSVDAAKAQLRLLRAVEAGWKPRKR